MAMREMTLTLAQLNPVVGDIPGNLAKIRETYLEADEKGVDLVLAPAHALTGAPLADLARDRDFLAQTEAALESLRKATEGRAAVLATCLPEGAPAVFARGDLSRQDTLAIKDAAVSLSVGGESMETGRAKNAAAADLLVNLAASPFRPGALERRVRGGAEIGIPFVSINLVGGQDETVFDGGSFCLGGDGKALLQLPQWEECVMDVRIGGESALPGEPVFPGENEEIWRAMVLGLRDYVRKSGFTDVVLGLSGGMDSAAVAAVAGDALGAEHVHCVRLPSRFTSDLSNRTAEEMCACWGFSLDTLPIMPVVEAAVAATAPAVPEGLNKLSRENLQARARGLLLMTLSNDTGRLLLSTGNKSEIAVGYATLYGDMCGAYNPLKDVLKTTVYAVSEWRNAHRPAGLLGPEGTVIPREIIDRPPSAELAPDQLDTDSLPPYPVLDAILRELVERETPVSALLARGEFEAATVLRVYRMMRNAEYKRRQSAPGATVSGRAFGSGRRMPIVNRFDPPV